MNRIPIFNMQGVELFVIEDFLNNDQCNHLCEQIKSQNQPSTVVGQGDDMSVHDKGRTSRSAFLKNENPIVSEVNTLISKELNIDLGFAEPTQGQLYHEGEFYNDHHDFFDESALNKEFEHGGQRTWTAMIYLNDVQSGGATEFPHLGKSIAPKKGMGVFWKNSDGRGFEDSNTLHSGRPVLDGEKMIITKWFRENMISPDNNRIISENFSENNYRNIATRDGEPISVKIEYVNGIPHARYKSNTDIPALTEAGFKKVDIPKDLYLTIMDYYKTGISSSFPEFDPKDKSQHLNDFIHSDKSVIPTQIVQLDKNIIDKIFKGLIGELEEWSGRALEPTYCYGIRTYNRGAVLKKHTDGFETRIVSVILNIDQKVEEPWALQIDDHEGNEHEVFLAAGEMVFYESAILRHGRVKPLIGDYYSNLFVHYINIT